MRDGDHMEGKGHIIYQQLDSQSACIFSHLDDTIMLGNSFLFSNIYMHYAFR